jgi:gas vesicle protein
MRRFMSFMAGAMCGALIGSVAALLLAPYSGDELREQVQSRTMAVRDDVREAYEARVAQLEAELDQLRSSVKKK